MITIDTGSYTIDTGSNTIDTGSYTIDTGSTDNFFSIDTGSHTIDTGSTHPITPLLPLAPSIAKVELLMIILSEGQAGQRRASRETSSKTPLSNVNLLYLFRGSFTKLYFPVKRQA